LLEVNEINNADRFFELRNDWDTLLERCIDDSVFLTWENMVNSVKHLEKGKRLRLLCIEDRGKIIAIAPLAQSRYSLRSCLGYEVIEPLADARALSDYTGLILAERAQECLSLFLNYLYEQNDWDFIYLYNVPETSIIFDMLSKFKRAFRFETRKGAICPYLTIPESISLLMNGLSAKFRKNLRRSLKRLEQDYGRVELKEYTELGSLDETMQVFFDLHQKRWIGKGRAGNFAGRENREIRLSEARLLAEKNWLALYFLTVNDKPIAAQHCLRYNQKMHYVLGGFDPAFSSYSVGNLIIMKVLERCIENKIKEYDFMKGAESYKFSWSKEYRRNLDTRFVSNKLASRLTDLGINAIKRVNLKILDPFLTH
jgi:CelD/BcsL family acetyltransferase involved in cellulose biosynthesis